VWAVTRTFRLNDAQAADAVQTTWLRLVEHLTEIREPERVAGWLRTTARRVCLATVRESGRELLTDISEEHAGLVSDRYSAAADESGPEVSAVRRDQQVLVRRAVATLPERHRVLLGLLASSPPASYEEISAWLGLPVGSIGPTRARILTRLRAELETVGLPDMALT
jgi:RNA polymerase sigma factor (sigma-70 family)